VLSPLAIERATLAAWPARETAEHHGWTLCATSGVSGRVNACWPLEWRGGDLDAAIDAAERWYDARHVRVHFKINTFGSAPDSLTARLIARGYKQDTPTLIMIASLGSAAGQHDNVALAPVMSAAFEATLREAAPDEADFAERRGVAARAPAPVAFATRDANGQTACVGMCAATGALAGIFLMRTAPTARRQGHARHVVRALMEWAAAQGAACAYLQVEADNAPAVALYEHEGFTPLYGYSYLRRA
jgi:ribosomal protein S18 acetylase RimI-like enzyme